MDKCYLCLESVFKVSAVGPGHSSGTVGMLRPRLNVKELLKHKCFEKLYNFLYVMVLGLLHAVGKIVRSLIVCSKGWGVGR